MAWVIKILVYGKFLQLLVFIVF